MAITYTPIVRSIEMRLKDCRNRTGTHALKFAPSTTVEQLAIYAAGYIPRYHAVQDAGITEYRIITAYRIDDTYPVTGDSKVMRVGVLAFTPSAGVRSQIQHPSFTTNYIETTGLYDSLRYDLLLLEPAAAAYLAALAAMCDQHGNSFVNLSAGYIERGEFYL